MEDELKIIFCMAVNAEPRYMVPGSTRAKCCDCGVDIQVAPSSQKALKEGAAITVCMSCGLKRAQGQPGELEVLPGQADEISQWRKRN